MVSERTLEYFGESITSCEGVANLADLFMWSQGPLWAFLPHDVMLFSVANSQSQWVLSDCLHSQPMKGQVVNALIDRRHGLLALLTQESRKLGMRELFIDAKGLSDQPIDPALGAAVAVLLSCFLRPDFPSGLSIFHSFALSFCRTLCRSLTYSLSVSHSLFSSRSLHIHAPLFLSYSFFFSP